MIESNSKDIACSLANLYRYQDDCIVFCDKDGAGEHVFESNISNIYPPEMELKPTNLSPNACTYLALHISIYRGKYNFR